MKIPNFIFCANLILSIALFSPNAYAQDTIYFYKRKPISIDIRMVEFKNGLIKVPQEKDNQIYIFNYLPEDIEYIVTSDSIYVKMIDKKHYDLLYLFTYWKDGVLANYDVENEKKLKAEDLKRKTNRQKEKKAAAAKKDSLKVEKDTSFLLSKISTIKWGLKADNSFALQTNSKVLQSANNAQVYTSYSSTAAFQAFSPSISIFKFDKFKNYHELGLNAFNYNYSDSKSEVYNYDTGYNILTNGITNFSWGFGIKYQYNWLINIHSKKFIPLIGFAVNPIFSYQAAKPKISTSFERDVYTVQLNTFVSPGFIYAVSDKIFIQAEVPLYLFYHTHTIQETNNPAIPISFRTISTNFSQFFHLEKLWSFKIGVGLRLK